MKRRCTTKGESVNSSVKDTGKINSSETQVKDPQFKCNLCGKLQKSLKTLKCHQFVHSTDRPYKCNNCDQSFKSRNNLSTHESVHITERSFKCDQFEKSFKSQVSLNRHQVATTSSNNLDKKILAVESVKDDQEKEHQDHILECNIKTAFP